MHEYTETIDTRGPDMAGNYHSTVKISERNYILKFNHSPTAQEIEQEAHLLALHLDAEQQLEIPLIPVYQEQLIARITPVSRDE